MTASHDREHKRAEIEQTLSGPCDMYPAEEWCKAANWLLSELKQAEAELAILQCCDLAERPQTRGAVEGGWPDDRS